MDDNASSPVLYLHSKTRKILRRGQWIEVGLLKRAKVRTVEPDEGENAHHRAMMVRQQVIWADRPATPTFVVAADDWAEIEGRPVHEGWPAGTVLAHEDSLAAYPLIGFAVKSNNGYFIAAEYIEPSLVERDGQKLWVTHMVEDGREKILHTPSSR